MGARPRRRARPGEAREGRGLLGEVAGRVYDAFLPLPDAREKLGHPPFDPETP